MTQALVFDPAFTSLNHNDGYDRFLCFVSGNSNKGISFDPGRRHFEVFRVIMCAIVSNVCTYITHAESSHDG